MSEFRLGGEVAEHARSVFALESITVGATSVRLTAATYAPATASGAMWALITIETDSIRFRGDGTAASATDPLATTADQIIICGSENIANFRAIRVTTNATIRVSYGR